MMLILIKHIVVVVFIIKLNVISAISLCQLQREDDRFTKKNPVCYKRWTKRYKEIVIKFSVGVE